MFMWCSISNIHDIDLGVKSTPGIVTSETQFKAKQDTKVDKDQVTRKTPGTCAGASDKDLGTVNGDCGGSQKETEDKGAKVKEEPEAAPSESWT